MKNLETENNFVNVNAEFAEVDDDDDDEGKTAKKNKMILGVFTEGEKRGWRWKAKDRRGHSGLVS